MCCKESAKPISGLYRWLTSEWGEVLVGSNQTDWSTMFPLLKKKSKSVKVLCLRWIKLSGGWFNVYLPALVHYLSSSCLIWPCHGPSPLHQPRLSIYCSSVPTWCYFSSTLQFDSLSPLQYNILGRLLKPFPFLEMVGYHVRIFWMLP